MRIRQRIGYFVVFYAIAFMMGDGGAIRTCLGAEPPRCDLVLLNSFANSEGRPGDPLAVVQLGFSKDGRRLACFRHEPTFRESGGVNLWDIETGKRVPVAEKTYPDYAPWVRCRFATVPHPRLCFWEASGLEVQDDLTTATRRPIRLQLFQFGVIVEGWVQYPIAGEGVAPMGDVHFSTNDEYLAALRNDRFVHVWNTRTGQHLWRFTVEPRSVSSMAFDPTNRYLAAGVVGSEWSVIVWDLKSGKEVLHTSGDLRVFQVAFAFNGDLICGEADAGLEVGRVTVRKAGDFEDAWSFHTPCGVSSLAVVPGVGIATGDWRGQVMLWRSDPDEREGGRLPTLLAVAKENGRHVVSLAVGKDGKLLAAGDWDSVARVWKIVTAQAPVQSQRAETDTKKSLNGSEGSGKIRAK